MAKMIKEMLCLMCSYSWYPRSASKPKMCPRCKSHKWNVGKKK